MDLHLTGSRFFGNAREDSDKDFLGQYSEQNLIDLLREGFEVGSVFLSNRRLREDVFLVNDVQKFLRARDLLKKLPLSEYPKSQHGYLWSQALEIVGK